MTNTLLLVRYHLRISLLWLFLVLPLALLSASGAVTLLSPAANRAHDFGTILEPGLSVLLGLAGSSLLISEVEQRTLVLTMVRLNLFSVLLIRVALLLLFTVACTLLVVAVGATAWAQPALWSVLLPALARACGFLAVGLFVASLTRSPTYGRLVPTMMWIGLLTFGGLLPRTEPWLTLNPFSWSARFPMEIVWKSTFLYSVMGLVLLALQPLLLRPERLLR